MRSLIPAAAIVALLAVPASGQTIAPPEPAAIEQTIGKSYALTWLERTRSDGLSRHGSGTIDAAAINAVIIQRSGKVARAECRADPRGATGDKALAFLAACAQAALPQWSDASTWIRREASALAVKQSATSQGKGALQVRLAKPSASTLELTVSF